MLALGAALLTVTLWASAFVGIRSAGRLLGETPPVLALLGGTLCLAGVAVARRAR